MFGRRGGTTHGAPQRGVPGGGRVVAVWGPTGSPGRSTVAAALAGALADVGRVVLVDADLTSAGSNGATVQAQFIQLESSDGDDDGD